MVIITKVSAKAILDSRKEKTILVSIKTNIGTFSASAPNGKSKGKREAKSYKKNIEGDIKAIKDFEDYFTEEVIEKFEDLRRIEDIVEGHVGANTIFALESAVLKAIAKEQNKQVWQVINPSNDFLAKANTLKDARKPKSFPRLVGNCIGGGKHSDSTSPLNKNGGRKPDFQEFLLIPDLKSVKDSFDKIKKNKENLKQTLKERDEKFKGEKNDEDAWTTSLNEKQILDVLNDLKIPIGVDIAASSFYKRKKYNYFNPMLKRDEKEQLNYLKNLIKNFNLFYIEDPFGEENFESFSELLKKFPDRLIVGDDLTVTKTKLLEKAIRKKSINGIIVKPNQNGSLLKVKKVCDIAKKNNIKIIFSHRSGETPETILADLAFGFGADFFKCGITGKEREAKINRLIEIEESLK